MPPLALLAGGLATRMRPLTETIPKSMLDVAGEPFIAHQLRNFKRQGIERVVVCAGYLGSMIEDFVKDGAAFGLNVCYSFDGETLLGTGGALRNALPLLEAEFVVVYGDSWLETDYASVVDAFRISRKPALMTVFRNMNAWDSSNVEFDGVNVRRYDKRFSTPEMHYIDWGMGVINASAFEKWGGAERFDLADLYADLVGRGDLVGYEVFERFYEIGSRAGLAETDALLRCAKSS